MICFYNEKILRTEIDVKYVGNKAVIVPLDVSIDSAFDKLLNMIYSRTKIDKKKFKLVINSRYPLKRGNRFQHCPICDDNNLFQMLKLVNTSGIDEIELYLEVVRVKTQVNQSLGTYTYLLFGGNDNVEELDYGCGPSSAPVALTNRCEVYGDDGDGDAEDCEEEEGDDESEGDGDVQANGNVSFFLTLHKLMDNEKMRYVSMDVAGCGVLNNPDPEDLVKSSFV